ncbi:MAG: helix-turn-helix domain-containing protein [Acidimicrobiia bacterium]|nr:helix-turn-helix domain-containing protein [Acidimicrobiia bacterium]
MDVVSVVEAAEYLEVSPRRVRQMLADDLLAGRQIGREWAIERRSVESLKQHRGPVGRPWRASSAWAVLAIADGAGSDLSPMDRSRARRRLAGQGLVGLAARLGARAEMRRFYGHPSVLGPLAAEPEVVRSGVSAAADHGADIVASDFLEAYVPAARIPAIINQYGLDPDAERPNILLRIVDEAAWPFAPEMDMASRSVVAVDLLEADDERSRRAGAELAQHL